MPNSAKAEAIRKAYGEYWGTYKDLVDDNGWFANRFTGNDIPNKQLDLRTEKDDKQRPFRFRIKGLQGIETNNGWIRIESEDDLPEDITQAHVFDDDCDITQYIFGIDRKMDWDLVKTQGITHYQPIVKPEKPIY